MARFISQLSQYEANNSGKTPGAGSTSATDIENAYNNTTPGFIKSYLNAGGDSFVDPNGPAYNVKALICTNGNCNQQSVDSDTKDGIIRVYTNATCDGDKPLFQNGERKIAITYKLEGAGIYCGHN